jgi:hypothetical protein
MWACQWRAFEGQNYSSYMPIVPKDMVSYPQDGRAIARAPPSLGMTSAYKNNSKSSCTAIKPVALQTMLNAQTIAPMFQEQDKPQGGGESKNVPRHQPTSGSQQQQQQQERSLSFWSSAPMPGLHDIPTAGGEWQRMDQNDNGGTTGNPLTSMDHHDDGQHGIQIELAFSSEDAVDLFPFDF